MDAGGDRVSGHVGHEFVPIFNLDHELMPSMDGSFPDHRGHHVRMAVERVEVARSDGISTLHPSVEVTKLNASDAALKFRKTEVRPSESFWYLLERPWSMNTETGCNRSALLRRWPRRRHPRPCFCSGRRRRCDFAK